jgi:hypothetical protein
VVFKTSRSVPQKVGADDAPDVAQQSHRQAECSGENDLMVKAGVNTAA